MCCFNSLLGIDKTKIDTMTRAVLYPGVSELISKFPKNEIVIVGKGPSLKNYFPFTNFKDQYCIGINNVYRYFPFCNQVIFWHQEIYESDLQFLKKQSEFGVAYGDFHGLSIPRPDYLILNYADEFVLDETQLRTFFNFSHSRWMYKASVLSAVKLALAARVESIKMIGFDFTTRFGYSANDKLLHAPAKLRNYTVEEIFSLQKRSMEIIADASELFGTKIEFI